MLDVKKTFTLLASLYKNVKNKTLSHNFMDFGGQKEKQDIKMLWKKVRQHYKKSKQVQVFSWVYIIVSDSMTTVSVQTASQKLDHSGDKSKEKEKVCSIWIHVWLWEDNTNKHMDTEIRKDGELGRPCFLRISRGMVCAMHVIFRWTSDTYFLFLGWTSN